MKLGTIRHKNLNNGKKTEIKYPISDTEFKNQFAEIFVANQYGKGKVKDAVYMDLGSNIGMTALYFQEYAKKYYAIEPSKQCFEALQYNTRNMKNIEHFNYAVSSMNNDEWIYQTAKDSTVQNFFAPTQGMIYNKELTKCKTLETIFKENKIDHIDVLKIDIEGMEFLVFGEKSFGKVADKIDMIIGEAHWNIVFGGIPMLIPQMLEQWGFKTEWI